MSKYQLTIQPDGMRITVETPITLLEAAQRGGVILDSVCGGAGTCKKCLVEIAPGREPVLACQCRLDRDMIVTIPESSRFFEQKILEEGIIRRLKIDPPIRKYYVRVDEPILADLRSDEQRLSDAVAELIERRSADQDSQWEFSEPDITAEPVTIPPAVLTSLPGILRAGNFAVTAVCYHRRIIAVESGDTTQLLYGLALDIGTTTVVAQLVNLADGYTVAIASKTNPQISHGDDVISRIEYTRTHEEGLLNLHRQIIDCINQLIAELTEKTGVSHHNIYEITALGNSTMQHLFLAVPVTQIAQAPYVSAFTGSVNTDASRLNIDIHPRANVFVMPGIAGHVGGDTVGVALASAMLHSDKINLALDIGTNGELILGNQDRLLTCSTAAGPAFEGGRISCGMRGAPGAIEQVHFNDDVAIEVIGGVKPIGLCGSGLIDTVAELLIAGLVEATGRMLPLDDLPADVPTAIRNRIVQIDNAPALILADTGQTANGHAVTLTQRDIRETQLAAAAIAAGAKILMRQLQIGPTDIDRIYLAGAFGNYIRRESARRLGLLPDVPLEKIQFIGNAAGSGAKEVLLCRTARNHADTIARRIEYVELAGRTDFQTIYSDCMFFPEK